jgi:hypothetical protein
MAFFYCLPEALDCTNCLPLVFHRKGSEPQVCPIPPERHESPLPQRHGAQEAHLQRQGAHKRHGAQEAHLTSSVKGHTKALGTSPGLSRASASITSTDTSSCNNYWLSQMSFTVSDAAKVRDNMQARKQAMDGVAVARSAQRAPGAQH